MRFLFRLDLSFHAGVGKKIEILNFVTKHGRGFVGVMHKAGNVGGEEEELCWVCAMTNGFILQAEAPNMQVNEHKVFSFERIFLSASEKLDLQILRLTK